MELDEGTVMFLSVIVFILTLIGSIGVLHLIIDIVPRWYKKIYEDFEHNR